MRFRHVCYSFVFANSVGVIIVTEESTSSRCTLCGTKSTPCEERRCDIRLNAAGVVISLAMDGRVICMSYRGFDE